MLFADAPGLKTRKLKDGTTVVYWACRHDMAKRGYRPKYFPLWRGIEPSETDRQMVADQCQTLQIDMITWGRGGIPELPAQFDGTVRGLIFCYMHDKDSTFGKLRFQSRKNYRAFMSRLERDHGGERIADLRGRDMLRWHEDVTERGVSMAHAVMRMFRGLLTYGVTILEDDDCIRLSIILGKMRFKMGKAREEWLTSEQANAIRALAHKRGLHSIALAQALQFEGMLRQKDVIGEWVPKSEPGAALAEWNDKKWQRGVVWSEIDENLILRHVTSKRGKVVEVDLRLAPMVQEELACMGERPKFGPVIVYEVTGRPYSSEHFRTTWRKLATECGVPRSIKNMDSRAGAATEATDAGADIEHVRQAMTHSNIATTQRYSRGGAKKAANVLRLRVEHRNKSGT